MRLDNEPANPPEGNPAEPKIISERGNAPASARKMRALWRSVLIAAAYLLAFIGLDLITKQFQGLPGIVAWYPPAGITYALLLAFGVTFTPAAVIALLISSIFIYRMPQPAYLLVLWALVLSLIYSAAAAFLRTRIRIDWQLRKLRDVTWFVFTAVIVSALLAVLSVSSSALSSNLPRSEFLREIFDWWIGETVGVLTVTPFLLIFVMPELKRFMEGQRAWLPELRSFQRPSLATIGQMLSIVLTLYWVFGVPVLVEYHPLFLIALPVIWVAMQRGLKGVCAAILVINSGVVLAIWLFRFDITRLGELELLMIVYCIIGLLMGAVVTERKQADDRRIYSELRFRALIENNSDAIALISSEGKIMYRSPAAYTLLGLDPGQPRSDSILGAVHPEDVKEVMKSFGQILQNPGLSIPFNYQAQHSDGSWRWVEGTGMNLLAETGVNAIVTNYRDVTERKRTESERQSLLEIMQGVAATDSLNELLDLIRQSLSKVIYAENFFVVFHNNKSGLFEEVFAVDKFDPPMPPSRLEKSIISYIFRTGQPLLLTQAKFEELVRQGEVELVGTKPAIWMGAPLKTPAGTIGVIAVQNYEDRDCYSERDMEFLSSVGAQVAVAIERKQVEEAHRISEEKYRTLVDEVNDGFYVTDEAGVFTFANPALARIYGVESPEELIGRKFSDFLSPERPEGISEAYGSAMQTGSAPAIIKGQVARPDGTLAFIEVKPSMIVKDGQISGTRGVVRDITERKQVSDKLEEERILLRTLIDNLPDRIFVMDVRGRKTVSNLADWKASGGKRMEDVLGKTDLETYPFELAKDYWALDKSVIENGKAILNREEPGLDPKGNPAWILSSKVPLLDGQGKVTGLVGIGRDITESKLAEETLQKSEKRFRALVDNSLEEISLLAADGTLTWESPSTRRPLGYPPDSFVGHSLLEIFHPDEKEAATRLLGRILEKPGNMEEAVFRLRHQDGSWRWMEAVINNLLDEPAVKSIVINYHDITERKQKEEEIISRTEELTKLYQLSRELADANEVKNVIDIVNRHAVESVHATFACIALLENDTLVLRGIHPVRNIEFNLNPDNRVPIASLPVCKRVLEDLEPAILNKGDPEVSEAERTTLMLDFAQSVCLVPLHLGDPMQHVNQTIGLLILGEAREENREPFTPEKIRLASSIGDQAAAAIRRLMLREQAGRRQQQLASLSEIDRTIASTFDLRVSLQIILKHVIEQLKVDAADVLVLNKHTQVLEYAAGSGFFSADVERIRQPRGGGQAGLALFERKLIKITDIATSGAVFAHPELITAEQAAAYFAMPLITKGQVMGVLEILHRTPLDPDEEWLDFFRTLAGQAAIAIDNVHMFESLQQSTDELELAYDATIEGWSHALDLRDKETEGHTQRVTRMTVDLARTFGLSEHDLVNVRWGALLHDIGKMGVPDGILLKPAALTDEEWVVMRKHPGLAYEMLSPIRYLHGALDIPYCHHEWWDGSGYPRGLKGEEIPLAARIFAVVDVWDALISDRPYRLAWAEGKALEHIQKGSGTHFDPHVVIKFLLGHGYQDGLHQETGLHLKAK